MPKSFDLVTATKAYKGELHDFFLDLSKWKKFKSKHKLNWQKTTFSAANKANIPTIRGIYAFTLELIPSQLPAHGYILYVGITGDASSANLQIRYSQYLRNLEKGDGRPRVQLMLENWDGVLQFNFVPLPDRRISLAKIERDFINAVIPPVNYADFSSELTAVRKADF